MQAVAARLLAIEADREQVDQREREQINACLSRFFQENCTRGARRDAALARQKLLQEEVRLRRIEREERVREQELRIADKQRERAEEAAAAAKAAQSEEARQRAERVEAARAAAAAAEAEGGSVKPGAPLPDRPRNPPLSAQPDAQQREANRAAAQKRQADAAARQAEIRAREEKRRQRQASQAARRAAEAADAAPNPGQPAPRP